MTSFFSYAYKKYTFCFPFEHFVSLFFYDFKLNIQGFVYIEFVKYQLGLHRNVHVIAKCNICLSAIQLFIYRHDQAFFLYRNKLYIFPMLGLAQIEYWSLGGSAGCASDW